MSLSLLFWILMLLWFVIIGVNQVQPQPWSGWGNGLLLFLILLTLGWSTFGAPIK